MKNILVGSFLVILYLILGILFFGEHYYMLPFMLVGTFIFVFFIFNKLKVINSFKMGLLIATPFPVILFLSSIFYGDFSRTLPYIIFVPLAAYLGYFYFKFRKIYLPILSLILFYCISYIISPNFFIYYHSNNSEKNIDFKYVTLVDKEKKIIKLSGDKIIVLDFWTTSCGICFKKFPVLEAEHQKYNANKNIEFYAVNVPINGDKFETTITILDSLGYTFPKFYAKSFQEIEANLKFNTFPHLMIIKNGKIRYEGLLVTKDESLFYNIDDEIEKLLNE